jgi:hypothetical protein
LRGPAATPDSSSNRAPATSQELGWVDLGLRGEDQVGPLEEICVSVEESACRWRSPLTGGGARMPVEEPARWCLE